MGWSAAAAVVATVASFASSQSQQAAANRQAQYQADVAAANAQALRNQAVVEADTARVKQFAIEEEKIEAGRSFRQAQGKNIATIAASGAEITSGSAMDLLEGNIDLYSQDVGTNVYQQQLHNWEARNTQRTLKWQADLADSQASFYQGSIMNSGTSLLTSGLKGLGSGLGTYAAFGGGNPFKGKSLVSTGAGKGLHGNVSGFTTPPAFKF